MSVVWGYILGPLADPNQSKSKVHVPYPGPVKPESWDHILGYSNCGQGGGLLYSMGENYSFYFFPCTVQHSALT